MDRITIMSALRWLIHARNSRGIYRAKTRALIHQTCTLLRGAA